MVLIYIVIYTYQFRFELILLTTPLFTVDWQVFVGSPADSDLQRGDVLLAIQGFEAVSMVHSQALDLIKAADLTLDLVIAR